MTSFSPAALSEEASHLHLSGFLIPKEILLEIISHCDITSFLQLQQTSRQILSIARSTAALQTFLRVRSPKNAKFPLRAVTACTSMDDIKQFYCLDIVLGQEVKNHSFTAAVGQQEDFTLQFQNQIVHLSEDDLLFQEELKFRGLGTNRENENEELPDVAQSPGSFTGIVFSIPPAVVQCGFLFPQNDGMQFIMKTQERNALFLVIKGEDGYSFDMYRIQSKYDESGNYIKLTGKFFASSDPAKQIQSEAIDFTSLIHSRLLAYQRDGMLNVNKHFDNICKSLYSLLYLEPFFVGYLSQHSSLPSKPGYYSFGPNYPVQTFPVIHEDVLGYSETNIPSTAKQWKASFLVHSYGMHLETVTTLYNITMRLHVDETGFTVDVVEGKETATNRDPTWS